MDDNSISFTEEYHKKLAIFGKSIVACTEKDNKHILFFKTEKYKDMVCISKKTLNILFFMKAHTSLISIPDDEFGITNIDEYMKFLNSIGYPKNELSSQKCVEVTNSYGQLKRSLLLSSKTAKYHLSLARPGLFSQENDKVVPPPSDRDPLLLLASITLSKKDIKEINSNISLLGSPEIFGLYLDNDIVKMYIKDRSGDKQYTKEFDPQCVKMNKSSGYTKNNIRLFPLVFIDGLNEVKSDFIIEIRYHAGADLIALKARTIDLSTDVIISDSVEILIATQESRKHTNITEYDIIE